MNIPSGKCTGNDKAQMTNDKNNRNREPFDLHERTRAFSLEVIYFFCRLKKDDVNMILGRQLLRAATSIGANYAEADHARSKAEFKSKIGDSLKEAGETKYWLLLFKQFGNKDKKLASILDESIQLEKIFYSIYHS
jgi:four helix bundle protein